MAIPEAHVNLVCKIGRGSDTCRYLGNRDGIWVCMKWTETRRFIDRRVELGQMRAHGDNCDGIKDAG